MIEFALCACVSCNRCNRVLCVCVLLRVHERTCWCFVENCKISHSSSPLLPSHTSLPPQPTLFPPQPTLFQSAHVITLCVLVLDRSIHNRSPSRLFPRALPHLSATFPPFL